MNPFPSGAQLKSIALPRPLRLFWFLNIFLGVLCVAIMRGGKHLFHWGYPYNYPFIPFFYWPDFLYFLPRFQHFHQLDFFSTAPEFGLRFMYPAPVALLYQVFYLTGAHSLRVFFAVTLSLVLFLAYLLGRAMVQRGIEPVTSALFLLSALVFSYPFWFEYLLGNMEICIFLIIAFGVLSFLMEYFYLAAALIGLAASMKIFPFVYLALFLSRRQYRQFAFGILVAVISNLFSLWLVCPSLPISYRGIQAGLLAFRKLYMLRYLPIETGFDHSLFAVFKRFMYHLHAAVHHDHLMTAVASRYLTTYLALAAVGGIALYFLRIRHLPLLNQILSLVIASVLLPPTSHDYTLLSLYLPWGLLVVYALSYSSNAHPDRRLNAALLVSFICFAVLFSPESELIQGAKGWSGQFKAATLVVIMITALRYPFPSLAHASKRADGSLDQQPAENWVQPLPLL